MAPIATFSLPANRKKSLGRLMLRGIVFGAAAAAAVCMTAASAAADTDTDSTDAHVQVESSIALTGLTDEFTLTGLPDAVVSQDGAVEFNVETNNLGGYSVTVESRTATLAGTLGNPDSIPIGNLSVRETDLADPADFDPMATDTTVVHTQAFRSDEGGDNLSNDYEVLIPFVNEDTYTATLDYIATTL